LISRFSRTNVLRGFDKLPQVPIFSKKRRINWDLDHMGV